MSHRCKYKLFTSFITSGPFNLNLPNYTTYSTINSLMQPNSVSEHHWSTTWYLRPSFVVHLYPLLSSFSFIPLYSSHFPKLVNSNLSYPPHLPLVFTTAPDSCKHVIVFYPLTFSPLFSSSSSSSSSSWSLISPYTAAPSPQLCDPLDLDKYVETYNYASPAPLNPLHLSLSFSRLDTSGLLPNPILSFLPGKHT